MLSFQRREEIKRILLQKRNVSVDELAKKFQVSDETVRRDLTFLSNEGFCSKTYGGASLAVRSTTHTPSNMKKTLCLEAKQRIAKIAASQIKPGDCIFLDHSTTAAELCADIRNMDLTIVTNSLWVLRELSSQENIHLVVTGGNVRVMDQGLFGLEALNFLRNHYFDKVFFSCRSLHQTRGIFDANEQVAAFRQTLCEQGARSYLMADSSKFGAPSFIHIMPYSKLDAVITDTRPGREWVESLTKAGVELLDQLPE